MPIPLVHSAVFAASLPFVEVIVGRKVVEDAIFAADLERRALEDPPLFIPLKVHAALAEALSRKTGEPCLPAIVTYYMPYEQLGIYANYVLSGDTLEKAIIRGTKGFKYIYHNSKVIFRVDGAKVFLGVDLSLNNHVGAENLEESIINSLIKLVRHFADEKWSPQYVSLKNPAIGSIQFLEQLYGSEIHCGANIPGIVFSAQTLELPNPKIPEARNASVYRDLRKLVSQYPGDRITGSIKQVIDLQSRMGDVSIEKVAERMNLSVRTLQRRLKAESESFQSCLDTFRFERATSLLNETQYSIPEIARALGFFEPNSFRRAFRNWTGISATRFRTQNRLGS